MKFELHPLASLFPRMAGAEFEALKADIKANGLRQPIVTHQGMILDGGNRYAACMDVGVKPMMAEYTGTDLVGYIESANLHRRHLETKSQRVAIAVALHEWVAANVGRPRVALGATLGKNNAQIAAQEHVGIRIVIDAKAAEKAGLGQAVRDGAMTAKEAAKVARGTVTKPKKTIEPSPPDASTELEETQQAVSALSEENDRLNDRLAVAAIDATEEERTAAAETIAKLRTQVKTLDAELRAVRASRDGLMVENNEMKKQIAGHRRQLQKLQATPPALNGGSSGVNHATTRGSS